MQDYSINSDFVKQLDKEILNLINSGFDSFDEMVFNELALKEFAVQYHNIDYYRNLCQAIGTAPETTKSWTRIPALNSSVFKETIIAAFPLHETELTLLTSGTSNPGLAGKIYRDKSCVEMYFLANAVMTKNFLFPDIDRMRVLLMVPSPKVAPSMGMAAGMEQLRQNFGTEDSVYLISPDGMEWEMLFNALRDSEESGKPAAIVGATSGLVYLFNFCRAQGIKYRLPQGSRVCDGGGYLGTFGKCSREEYLKLCSEVLGIPPEYCVNTLGSSESATNYFDNVLRNHYLGIKDKPRYKASPPWARTIVTDPETGRRLSKGETGLLSHYDLANRANIMVVQTNNLGYEVEGGFEIIGRADAGGKAADTFLNRMLSGQVCSTVADNMLTGDGSTCATVADNMLAGKSSTCSTIADNMLANSPHGNMFDNIPRARLEKLKQMCPFLRLQGLFNKDKCSIK